MFFETDEFPHWINIIEHLFYANYWEEERGEDKSWSLGFTLWGFSIFKSIFD